MGSLRFQSSWSGLKNLSFTINHTLNEGKKDKFRGKRVYASLFGVGAPEALVIGVVALLVFGPKGLAEVARNLGKTLRAFQPTIRELQDVSREFKGTLEREIGLDEFSSSTNNTYKPTSFSNDNQQATADPNGTTKSAAYTSEDLLKITQEQLAASAKGPQAQEDSVMSTPSKITSTGTPASSAQTQPSGKDDKETRL
ncbi:sec-independent protein translocase protein TATB, chloroplastic [Asparagus officinalis]|uniref:sec-independent protein translocase protein TATB, chloroplastic n=1 Tax=Asparagus officinalis TaxID=4686 RepID=UPI00098E03C0|nr:sec-independent protein translocase protein TATB, chloroplastic [Asparagus officinalis]